MLGGKDNFKNRFPILAKTSGFSEIEILGVVRDAETNAKGAFNSITGVLSKIKLIPPTEPNTFTDGSPSIGIFIMPDNNSPGMLEDLCLNTVVDNPAMVCVDGLMNCCAKNLDHLPENPAKAKTQAYLAAMPQIANSLGVGAKKGYWNFESEYLDDLKRFLAKLG